MSIFEAARSGTDMELLEAMRDRIAEAVDDPQCPKRDLASLTLRLSTLVKEISFLRIQVEEKDEITAAARVPDAPFDSSEL